MSEDSTRDPKVGDTMIVLRSSHSSPQPVPHRAKVTRVTPSGLIDAEFSTTVGAPRTLRFKAWKRRSRWWGPGRYAVDEYSRSYTVDPWWALAWPLPGELEASDAEEKRVTLLFAVRQAITRHDHFSLEDIERIAAILSIYKEDKT